MDQLIGWLKSARRAVVFTGAGISTLSGIPDFRGKAGIYKTLPDPDRIFSIDGFRSDPAFFYRHAKDFIYNLGEREPNIVHRECARLERMGLIEAVITQNIDMLHQRAGSRNVIELHGSPARHRCLKCAVEFPFEWARECVMADETPRCPHCGGVVKPCIVFFGERLDEQALASAARHASEADLLLALGSSLVVQPAASIPLYTARHGGRVVIVNDAPTPLDDIAAARYEDLETCFGAIAKRV